MTESILKSSMVRKVKNKGVNNFGKLTFTDSSPFVIYNGEKDTNVACVFHQAEFALIPVEDWNGNQFIYKLPLRSNDAVDTVSALVILKEHYCLFNDRTSTLITYNVLDKEYFISNHSYFLTEIRVFHFGAENSMDEMIFNTQKEMNLSDQSSPQELKLKLLSTLETFYNTEIYNAYFR